MRMPKQHIAAPLRRLLDTFVLGMPPGVGTLAAHHSHHIFFLLSRQIFTEHTACTVARRLALIIVGHAHFRNIAIRLDLWRINAAV